MSDGLATERQRSTIAPPVEGEHVLFRSASVAIVDLDPDPSDRPRPGDGLGHWHRLLFTRAEPAPLHARTARGIGLLDDPVQVRSLPPHAPWPAGARVRSPVTIVALEPELVAAARRALPGTADGALARIACPADVTAPPALLLRARQLRQALLRPRSTREGARAELEAEALGLFHALADAARRDPASARPAQPPGRQRALADAARALLVAAPHRAHPLGAVARALGISASHLAHGFRAEVGMPIHQYLLALRLVVALDCLTEGEAQLSRLALDLGFASHSHFSAAFRKAFGVPPIAVRTRLARGAQVLHHPTRLP